MKKYITAILALIVLLAFTTNSIASAATVASTAASNKISQVKSIKGSKQDNVEIYIKSYTGYTVRWFTKPNRIVIDIPKASAPSRQVTKTVNGKYVKAVRYAQFDKNTARVVIDVIGNPKYSINAQKGKLIFYISNPLLNNFSYFNIGTSASLVLSDLKLIQNDTATKIYSEKYEDLGKKYTISFPSDMAKLTDGTAAINDTFLQSIQVSTDVEEGQTSISFLGKRKLEFLLSQGQAPGDTVVKMYPASETSRGDGDRDVENLIDIKHVTKEEVEEISIPLAQNSTYNVTRLTNPERLLIDVSGLVVLPGQQVLTINSSMVKSIRYSQFDASTARVEVDTNGQLQYNAEVKDNILIVTVQKTGLKNVTYKNNGDRVCLLLDGVELTEEKYGRTKQYTGSYDETYKKYTVMFPSSRGSIGSGILNINDSYLESFEIHTENKNTYITFCAKDKFAYRTITQEKTNDTAITILKPALKEDKLVVIDPGHGGVDPGAVCETAVEKNLNLDIAIRLNKLLKQHNVKTYMLREDDYFIGLYERAYIANDLNAALFLSIHNNAMDIASDSRNAQVHGTETFYYSDKVSAAGFSGKGFAAKVQSKLSGTLGTYNRGIKKEAFVVVKETKMPAALAEVGFITNRSERGKLLDESYRQKSAEALCNAILETLK